ncbi:MAG: hypothetical protein WC450_05045 [Candidatus Omnitrophota bacterium]
MDDFLGIMAVQAVLIAVGVVIGLVFYCVRAFMDRKNMPEGMTREAVIEEIRQMNDQGLNYKEKLAFIQKKGFRRNVADQLLAEEMRRHKDHR